MSTLNPDESAVALANDPENATNTQQPLGPRSFPGFPLATETNVQPTSPIVMPVTHKSNLMLVQFIDFLKKFNTNMDKLAEVVLKRYNEFPDCVVSQTNVQSEERNSDEPNTSVEDLVREMNECCLQDVEIARLDNPASVVKYMENAMNYLSKVVKFFNQNIAVLKAEFEDATQHLAILYHANNYSEIAKYEQLYYFIIKMSFQLPRRAEMEVLQLTVKYCLLQKKVLNIRMGNAEEHDLIDNSDTYMHL